MDSVTSRPGASSGQGRLPWVAVPMQTLATIAVAALAIALARMTVSQEVRSLPQASSVLHEVWAQLGLVTVLAVGEVVAAVGLWRRATWAWKFAVRTNAFLVLLVVLDWALGGHHVDHLATLLFFGALLGVESLEWRHLDGRKTRTRTQPDA